MADIFSPFSLRIEPFECPWFSFCAGPRSLLAPVASSRFESASPQYMVAVRNGTVKYPIISSDLLEFSRRVAIRWKEFEGSSHGPPLPFSTRPSIARRRSISSIDAAARVASPPFRNIPSGFRDRSTWQWRPKQKPLTSAFRVGA